MAAERHAPVVTDPTRDIRAGSEVPGRRALPEVIRWRPDRDAAIRSGQRRGTLVRVRPAVYAPETCADQASPAIRTETVHLRNVAAALESLRTDFWVSHVSAALLWGCWVYRLGTLAEITQLHPPDVRESAGPVRRHWTKLQARDRDDIDGVPVTTLERTVVDCALALPPQQAIGIVESGLRMGADRGLVEQILAESGGKRGVRSARQVIGVADGLVESLGEARLRWTLFDAGLPPLSPSIPVETHRGTRWVDLGWEDLKVGFEFDGKVKYSGKYGDPADVLWREKERHDALVEAGWILVRVMWADLDDVDALLARARRARARASSR